MDVCLCERICCGRVPCFPRLAQSNVWSTWSPIVDPVQELYGWSSGTVDILAAWGPLIYLPLSFVCPRIVEMIGLRATITLSAALITIGSVIRSITTVAPYAVILAHAGQIFNACAGPFGKGRERADSSFFGRAASCIICLCNVLQ